MLIARTSRMLFISVASCVLAFSAPVAYGQQPYASPTIDIGLVVSDLDASVAFYEEALGMQQVSTFSVDSTQARQTGLTDGAPFHAVVMKLGEGDGASALKLVRVGEPERSRPAFIDERSGIRYITLQVVALRPMLERLQQHDVAVLGDAPVPLGGESYFALVQDPDGVFIELIGPLDAARTSP